MVITCPHALGLAVPLVIAVSTAIAAKNGLLIRDLAAFEKGRKIEAVLFDKTGTLTKGEYTLFTLYYYCKQLPIIKHNILIVRASFDGNGLNNNR